MAPPVVFAVVAVASAVTAIGSGVMSYMQAQGQAASSRAQADYARAMAARNQQISEIAAQNAEAKGKYEAGLQMERTKKLLSRQIALTGASGTDIYGSPLEVMGQSWFEGKRDADTMLYNAAYEAWKYRTAGETSLLEGSNTASRYELESDIYGIKGIAGLAGGVTSAGTSLLTGYGNYKYLKSTSGYDYQPGGYGFKDW